MKTLKNTFAILLTICLSFSLALLSCSKDNDEPIQIQDPTPVASVYLEENFLNQYFLTSGLQFRRNIEEDNYRLIEYLEFSASEKGKITSFSFKVPATTTLNSVILRLVDLETGLTVKEISTNANAYTAGTTKIVTLSEPIELNRFKRYKFGMISKSSYEYRRLDGENIVYPIQAGNIKIWAFTETNLNTSSNSNNPSHYYGDFSFTFQRIQ